MGAELGRRARVQAEIEYEIVALGLKVTEIAEIINDATGVTVDPATQFLESLNESQLEATCKQLSQHRNWRKRNADCS